VIRSRTSGRDRSYYDVLVGVVVESVAGGVVSREKSRNTARARRGAPVTGPADDEPAGPDEIAEVAATVEPATRGSATPSIDPETEAALREKLLGPE
jgi:hypothetical protein